jgi:hypothetical protein
VTVPDRDREFMRRIGVHKAEAHADAASKHRESSLAARLERSWALYLATRSSARLAGAPDDDPSPFYERARARGLYRP